MPMQDNEPTLSSIEDYDTLKGSKKKVVWTVIITGLLIGVIFLALKTYYGNVQDTITVKDTITKVPAK